MKRVLFILMLMTIGLSAQAAEELKVGGVTVNLDQDTNGGLIGLAGFYYYYHEEKTLKIYNGIMTNGGIESSVKDLTIEFYGNNILIYINLKADTHLTNQGTVTINPSTSYAMFTSNAQVDITGGTWVFKACVYLRDKKLIIKDGADVSITHTDASEYGISTSQDATVEVDNATLKIDVPTNNRCTSAAVLLKNSVINSPLKTVLGTLINIDGNISVFPNYSSTSRSDIFDTNGEFLKGSLTIKPGTAYDLWLAGVQVNSENLDKLWQLDKSGNTNSISYTPSTKTLSLNNAQLNSKYIKFLPIYNKVTDLKINAVGNCYIGGDNNPDGIESTVDFTINGGGTLQVFGNNDGRAIDINKTTLTIKDVTLKAIGGKYGLYGINGSTVKVNNSYLTVSGTDKAISVGDFDPDRNCFFMSPANATNLGTTVVSMSSTGTMTTATYVQTRPMVKYPLYINGTQVSEVNCNEIMKLLGMPETLGSITFYPPNELRINNLKIDSNRTLDDYFISTTLDELILNLTGTSYINATGKSLTATNNVTVTGTGVITIDTGDNGMQVGGTLKITGSASFTGGGKILGIGTHKLVMTPGTQLKAISSDANGRSLFCDLEPELDGVALPADMYYNPSMRCICYKANDQPVARNYVKINADNVNKVATSIEEPDAFDTDASTRVYTTTGQLVWQGTGQPQLPSGIYIVNGTKVVINR